MFKDNPTTDERHVAFLQYGPLLKEHVSLTQQIKRLEASDIGSVREADRIKELDGRRQDVHRQLEGLGKWLYKTVQDVRMDILDAWYQTDPSLSAEGISCFAADYNGNPSRPHAFMRPDRSDTRETYSAGEERGMLLMVRPPGLDRDHRIHATSDYKKLESAPLEKLRDWVARQLHVSQSDVIIAPVESHEGVIHTEIVGKGLFIPERFAQPLLERLLAHTSEWQLSLKEILELASLTELVRGETIASGVTSGDFRLLSNEDSKRLAYAIERLRAAEAEASRLKISFSPVRADILTERTRTSTTISAFETGSRMQKSLVQEVSVSELCEWYAGRTEKIREAIAEYREGLGTEIEKRLEQKEGRQTGQILRKTSR